MPMPLTFFSTECPACREARERFMDSFKQWLRQPYSTDMDAFHWFLFFGLMIAISILWGMSLRALQTLTSD
jgi:hypothetical protein